MNTKIDESKLISGKEALIALANGEEVQIWNGNIWWDVEGDYQIDVFLKTERKFRLKPRTIKLNVEIPAPFEPKEGDVYWHISPVNECGYKSKTYQEEFNSTQFGAWRTEDEIKQVVAALRGWIKG